MKRFNPFRALILFTAMTLLFASCNSGDKKTTETPTGDTTTTPEVKVNTIVTTPQLMGMIKHKVKDYAAWKAAYDSHDSARLANGLHRYVIGRGMDDSMMVLIAMKATPEISFVNVVWQDTVNVGSIPRVITSFTVKDFDTAKKGFEEGRQERMDNGITDRQYGHDADDNHKVSMVTALTDVDKAKAYWGSDAIKKRIEAGGLTTQPQRFIFNIVARY